MRLPARIGGGYTAHLTWNKRGTHEVKVDLDPPPEDLVDLVLPPSGRVVWRSVARHGRE